MLSVGEIRRLVSEKDRRTSVAARDGTNSLLNAATAAATILENTIPKAPQLSDFLIGQHHTNQSSDGADMSHRRDSFPDKSMPLLSSPSFLEEVLNCDEDTSSAALPSECESRLTPIDVLLSYPVYSRILPLLPMKDILSLAQTCKAFSDMISVEKVRVRRQCFQFVHRKEFIRYLNLSLGSQKVMTERQVYGSLFRDLFILPQHILMFYSPDIFQYDVRILGQGGQLYVSRPDHLLDNFLNQTNGEDLHVWHFRLFSVIKPLSDLPMGQDHSNLTRSELNRFRLWHSEDLAMVILPAIPNIHVVQKRMDYREIFHIPSNIRDRIRDDLTALLLLIEAKYKPKFVFATARDIQRASVSQQSFNFPIILFDNRVYDIQSSEEFVSLSGDVTVHQVILDVVDRRETRDMKLRMLHAQLGVERPSPSQCWLLYFTEMWPGGTSKEIPACDVIMLRNLFPGVPVFGGRAKMFIGNQHLPVVVGTALEGSTALQLRTTPTIVTLIYFGI